MEQDFAAVKADAPALLFQNVSVKMGIGKKHSFCLSDISFSLERGYILGLIGRNGAGKTTLIRSVLQLVPFRGHVEVAGYSMQKEAMKAKQRIAYIGDDLLFLSNESLKKCGQIYGAFYENYHEERYLELLERLEIGSQQRGGTLSKGQNYRAQLAFALSHEAELLLMDEPTGGLDPIARQLFLRILQEELEKERMGILFSTHVTEDLDKIADYVMLLEKGKMAFWKTKEELWEELRDKSGEVMSLQKMMYLRDNQGK